MGSVTMSAQRRHTRITNCSIASHQGHLGCPWGRLGVARACGRIRVLRLAPPPAGTARAYARRMRIRFCDERGADGFSWVVDEPATRTSHALAAGGRVWVVDPVRFEPALERLHTLGKPAGVVQLLDRHNRDCATVAGELGVPHLVVPDELPGSGFEVRRVKQSSRWHEVALWSPALRTLVVAEAIGTNRFFAGRDPAGVHLLLRLTPPRKALASLEPEHLLVGHGEGLHGPAATEGLEAALAHARTGLPRLLLTAPAFALDAIRRRTA